MELSIQQLGPYRLHEKIGEGSSSVVYRATKIVPDEPSEEHSTSSTSADSLPNEVAIKVLPPELARQDGYRQRFLREGHHARRLEHINIVRTYEASEAEGYHYLVMEHVKGGTLSDYINQQQTLLPIAHVLDILSQVAAALDYAHSQGFIHRDLKLNNILLAPDRRVLLSDFGISKRVDADLSEDFTASTIFTTQAGQMIGTPAFMSPEQIRGEFKIDYRSDVYSLGVVAYALLTGRLPFSEQSAAALMQSIAYDQPVPLCSCNPDVPEGVEQVVQRAMDKLPQQRYESGGLFVAALSSALQWKVIPIAEKTVLPDSEHSAPDRKPRVRLRRVFTTAVAAAVLTLVLFLVLPNLLSASVPGELIEERMPSTSVEVRGELKMLFEAGVEAIGEDVAAIDIEQWRWQALWASSRSQLADGLRWVDESAVEFDIQLVWLQRWIERMEPQSLSDF